MPGAPVLVVTSDPDVAALGRWRPVTRVVADPGAGLDAAVAAGVDAARTSGADRVAVVLATTRPCDAEEVRAAVAAAGEHPASVLADADDDGTALLTLPATGARLRTAFGPGSAAAHERLGHHRLDLDLPGLRVDVDDAASLAAAVATRPRSAQPRGPRAR